MVALRFSNSTGRTIIMADCPRPFDLSARKIAKKKECEELYNFLIGTHCLQSRKQL